MEDGERRSKILRHGRPGEDFDVDVLDHEAKLK
jgi:hypothetical protein